MKILGSVLLMVAIAATVAMVSCTKKYTCQCQLKYTGAPGLPDSVVNEYEIYDTKKKAADFCKKESYEKVENGIKITETCKLY